MTLVTRHIIGRAQSVPRKAVPDVAPPKKIEALATGKRTRCVVEPHPAHTISICTSLVTTF